VARRIPRQRLAQSAGHADRIAPFKAYCTGLLLPGERKSIDPWRSDSIPTMMMVTFQLEHNGVYRLSITHKSSSQLESKLNIGQSGESTPHDGIAGWRIVPSCEIAAQARDLGEVSRELRVFPCGRFG